MKPHSDHTFPFILSQFPAEFQMGDLHSRLSVALGQFGWFLKACLFRKYKKKVLLIGIDFESSLASGGLHRHRDVRLSNICSSVSGASHFTSSTSLIVRMNLDQYGYQFEDVVVMLDGGAMEDPKLAPTRRNIVKCSTVYIFGV